MWLWLLLSVAAAAEVKERQLSFTVPEDAPPNTLIGFLQDPPPPRGAENFLIVFPPETEVEETLVVDAATGEIRTRKGLDYERKRELVFLAIPIHGSSGIRVNIAVLDHNDHSPVFPVHSLQLQLSEYAKIGSETPLPSATDADSPAFSVQHYRIVSGNVNNAFRLSTKRLSGTLYLDLIVNAELDREFRSGYQLSIEALDGGQPPRTATLAVSIAIIDANDNPPQFAQPRYLAQLMENATVGQQVIQVSATDADEGANAQIEYRLAPSPASAHSYFSISPDTGLVRLRRRLPTQARPQQLELLVVARDKGLQPLESTAFVTISVLSPSQYLPQISVIYLSSDGEPSVSEAARVGDFLARLSVRDPETSEEYTRPVNLSFAVPNAFFGLSKTKEAVYILTLARTLDREVQAEQEVELVAVDSAGRVGRKKLSILVSDINDSPPQFTQATYEAEVEERAGIGASVLQVTAVDPDAGPNGTVRYSLDSPHEGWFDIDASTGLITTLQGIDCEVSSQPRLSVTARDLGFPPLSSTATVRLRILDVNDNAPVFSKSIYNVTLGEDTEVGSCFLKVSAADPDCGVNAAVRYALEEGGGEEWSLDEGSGTLCLERPLDYERRSSFQFQVYATDGGGLSSSSLVRVRVEDRDDNAPVFYPSLYNVSLRHDAPPGLPLLLVSATDADSGSFADVHYSLTPTPDAALFRIHGDRGELYVDSTLHPRTYRLTVEAVDGGGLAALSPAVVNVNVLPANQLLVAPSFAQKLYRFSIREDTLPGIALGSVEAQGSGQIRYSIYSGDPEGNFAIDPDTGSITVQQYLDADARDSLLLNVQAALGDPPIFNHTQVRIEITDVNDNGPEWERGKLRTAVGEDQSTEVPFYVVEATDRDGGRNGELTYRILESTPPGPFLVRPLSGELFVVSPLDYEEHRHYQLTLSATDSGLPPKSAQLTLQIEVTDANDHAPAFSQMVFDAAVSEDAPVLHRITQVTATDADSGHNGHISYSLGPPHDSDSVFGVMADSGWVYVRKALDRETTASYNIEVVARDNGSPSMSSTARVRIAVLDANDNSPTCGAKPGAGRVEENSPARTFVGKLSALDADEGRNASLTFHLLNHQHLFFLEPTGARTFVGKLSALDADEGRNASLTFHLLNHQHLFFLEPTGARTFVGKLSALDADEGRNASLTFHLLNHQHLFFLEPTGARTFVGKLSALDADEGRNASLTFHLLNHQHLFFLEPTGARTFVGKLSALDADEGRNASLTFHLLNHQHLFFLEPTGARTFVGKLSALDADEGRNASLTFHLLNHQHLFFLEPTGARTFVGKLSALDADEGRNASLTFHLLNHQHLFFLEPTGELYTRGPLDAEVRTEYELSVKVADEGVPSRSAQCPFLISVADNNDNSPFFVLPYQSKVTVREEVGLGTELVQVRATDPDSGRNGSVEYALGVSSASNFFRIHPKTGVITVTARLDFETLPQSNFVLEIIARDGGNPSKTSVKKLEVEVTDIPDSEGTSAGAEFKIRFQTPETSVVGTRIGALEPERAERFRDITADLDAESLDLLFEITGGNSQEIFDIDRVSSVLYLVKPLDYETSPLHVLKISRIDQSRSGLPIVTETRVEVAVTDTNDNSPIWEQDPVITSLPEDAPIGHLVWKFAATDADAGANGRLVYSVVEQSPTSAFAIDPVTGELWVDSPLDYEQQSEYLVVVQATDQALEVGDRRRSRVTARIYLTDLNDNAPRFVSRERVDVFEDEPAGYPIIHVLATDPDWEDNGRVTYTIIEGDEERVFALNSSTGALLLAQRLSPHSQERKFQLRVLAEDHGTPPLSATQLLDVYVLDVNKKGPRFTHSVYKATVPENANPGTPVVAVNAENLATGYKDLVYSLPAGLSPANFKIDSRTGQIVTTSILDREIQSRYILTVYVRMGSGGWEYDAATVVVEVGDENDGRPILGSGACAPVALPENTPFHAFHTARASDPDAGHNALLTYSITGGNVDGKFEMNPSTGELSCQPLDRETAAQYALKIVVQDAGSPSLSDSCQMQVTVLDLNDESPVFSESEYAAEVPEDIPVGSTILTVSARDADAPGPNSRLTYSLRNHSAALFLIHPQTGAIQTLAPLDAETRSLYTFNVLARDEGVREPREATSRVTISVLDLNDHSPVFASIPFLANISTNTPSGQRILRVAATDADGPGDHSRVTYRFLQNHDDFSINPNTGVISARRDLHFRTGTIYYLEVEAGDGGGRATVGMVEVRVGGAVSPELLRFPQNVYRATISEDAAPNTLVHTCEANKRGPDGRKTYRIVAGDPQGIFIIDSTNGRVVVGKAGLLDRETEPLYRLVVECASGDEHAFTALVVEVLDANDHEPQFLQQRYASAVWEGKPPRTFVMQVSAVDRDMGENAHITYSIVSGNQDSAFVVDEVGRVSTGLELDREIKDRYQLSLMATDAGSPPKSSTTLLEIQVVDVNDNKPSFPPAKSITLSEATALGTQLGLISANDVDQEPALVYSFRQGGNPGNIFAIDPFTGRLSLAKKLDYETAQRHLLQVQVSDEIHVATTPVEIVVTDENDNDPEFSQSFYQVSLPEDTPPGASILQLDATDADSADAGRLKYSLSGAVPSGESSPGFWISPTTGALHTNLSLASGRYRGSLMELGVAVEDGGTPPRSAFASVQIQILSRAVQGQPKFAEPEYRFSVDEDTPPHTPLGSVAVPNPDSFQGILYDIVSGNEDRKFRVDGTGQIILNRHLDREEQDQYELEMAVHVKANSVANSTTRVIFAVEDVNDCAPVFREKEVIAKIGESASLGYILITLSATDADTGKNGIVSYEITSGNEQGYFVMDEGTGVISVAKRLGEGSLRLIVKAKDGGDPPRSAIATVLVSVHDENENGPFFPIPLLLGRISENAPPGTLVFSSKATDRDGSDYGKLTYELRDSPGPGHGTAKGLFKINPVSGEVRTIVSFDYEVRNTYYFLVEAIDKGGRTATVPGQVLIRGVDEFAPAFNQPSYSFSVPYDAPLDYKVGVIYATDADAGLDGIISYRFQEPSEYFTINSATGVISVTMDLRPLAQESPIGIKPENQKQKRAATIDTASIGGENDPYKDADIEPLVRIMYLNVVAESGNGQGKRNVTTVEFKLGHFSQTTLRSTVLDSRTITIISIILILLLILILLFVALKLRRKKEKAPSPLQKKTAPRVHSGRKSGGMQRPLGPRVDQPRRHHSGPKTPQAPYSRPPAVKVSAYANGESFYGVGGVRRPVEDAGEYQRPGGDSTFQPRPPHQPNKHSGSNISNRSSGHGSVAYEDDETRDTSPHLTSRMMRSEQVRSIPDSGIHVFPDDNASVASDLPSAQDYLTSLGVTAPMSSDHHSIHGRLDYAESQTDDGVDVQELIYSKVSEVLGEEGNSRLLEDTEVAAMRTFYPSRGEARPRGGQRGPPPPALPGPSYQPLTHVFSEISKLKSEHETLRKRQPPPPPTRLTFAPPLPQTEHSPAGPDWMPQYASPDEPPPPPPPTAPYRGQPSIPRRVSRTSVSESEREIKI